jgi:hypothetical protein
MSARSNAERSKNKIADHALIDITESQWQQAYERIHQNNPHAKTTAELSKIWSISIRQAQSRIKELVEEGKVIGCKKIFKSVTGANLSIPAYILKP